jgi:hypothetical protein
VSGYMGFCQARDYPWLSNTGDGGDSEAASGKLLSTQKNLIFNLLFLMINSQPKSGTYHWQYH